MKQLIIALSLALVSSVALADPAAAPAGSPHEGKVPPIARIQNDLGLTDEQVKKMREIRDGGGSRAEMNAVLTPQQRTKAAALHKEHKNERGDRRTRMQQQLGLSDAQVTKMEEIRKKGGSREELRAVLTPEQQAKFDAARSTRDGRQPKPGGQKPTPPAQQPTPAVQAPTPVAPEPKPE